MEVDPVLAGLLMLLGAVIAYVADEILGVTPRLSNWLDRLFD